MYKHFMPNMVGGKLLELDSNLMLRYIHLPRHGKPGPIISIIDSIAYNFIRVKLLSRAGMAYVKLFICKAYYYLGNPW
jgi:hypothetical protein